MKHAFISWQKARSFGARAYTQAKAGKLWPVHWAPGLDLWLGHAGSLGFYIENKAEGTATV